MEEGDQQVFRVANDVNDLERVLYLSAFLSSFADRRTYFGFLVNMFRKELGHEVRLEDAGALERLKLRIAQSKIEENTLEP